MAVLSVELNYLPGVQSSIAGVVSQLESRKSDYEGAINKVNRIGASTDCNIYLKKKNQQLQDKIDKLNNFKSRVSNFSANVKAADQRVATHVRDESAAFYETVGIKTGWQAAVEAIKDFAVNAWETVKEFYQKHKYVIDLIVDIVFVAAAIVSLGAASGFVAVFFAGFALAQALGDVFTSSIVLGYHIAGNDEQAGVWAERGLKDGAKMIFGEQAGGIIYDLLSLASVTYSAAKLGKNLFKSIDLRNTNSISVLGRFTNAGKEILGIKTSGMSTSLKALGTCIKLKAFLGLKSVDAARNILIGCDVVKNVKTTVKVIDSIYKGTFLEEGTQIGNTITKTVETIKSLYKGINTSPALQ